MAYSLDFRRHAIKIKERENLTFEKTAERFGIGARTLFRWQNRIEPKTKRDRPAVKIDMDKLKEDVKKHPDDFQYERAERFGVSRWGIGLALRRLGITYKKNPESPRGRLRKTYCLPV